MNPEEDDTPVPEAVAPTESVAEPGDVRKRARKASRRVQTSAKFWQAVLATEEGRAEIWAVLSHAGTFDFRAGVTEGMGFPHPEVSWHQLGQKAIGEWLYFRLMAYNPDGVALMLREHQPFVMATAKEAARAKTRTKGA